MKLKLKTLHSRLNDTFDVGKVLSDTKSRFSLYFWILLILPAIITFFSNNALKFIFLLPMVVNVMLAPCGLSLFIQAQRIKRSSTLLLVTILADIAIHLIQKSPLEFDRTFLEIISLIASAMILIQAKSLMSQEFDETEEEKIENTEKSIKRSMKSLNHFFEYLNFALIPITAGCFYYQPIVLLSLIILGKVVFYLRKRLGNQEKLIKAILIGYICLQVIPYETNATDLIVRAAHSVAILMTCLFILEQAFLYNLKGQLCFHTPKGFESNPENCPDKFYQKLLKSPNYCFILDRGWSFTIPIPILFCTWALSRFASSISSEVLGIVSVTSSTVFIIYAYTPKSRLFAIRLSQVYLLALAFAYLFTCESNNDRMLILTAASILLYLTNVMEIIYIRLNAIIKLDQIKVPEGFVFPDMLKSLGQVLEHVWNVTSAPISAFIISACCVRTLSSKFRLILLGFTVLAAIFQQKSKMLFWFFIQFYVLIEQTVWLFLNNPTLPAEFDDITKETVFLNLAILCIAELQRLRHVPSIFNPRPSSSSPDTKNNNNNRISDHSVMKATEEEEDFTEEITEVTAEEEEEISAGKKENEISASFAWNLVEKFKTLVSAVSTLVLMGVLLFYPQLVDVSFQTCFYSMWAGLFVFLFYRPNGTSKLRRIFIKILAISSASFFIYNLYELDILRTAYFDRIFYTTVIKDPRLIAENRFFILHAVIFWLSCVNLIALQFQDEEADAEKLKNDEKSEDVDMIAEEAEEGSTTSLNIISKTSQVLERVFVIYWTRLCALLAFFAACINPSIFGVCHLMIGCILVWRNILSPALYIPMILWLLCATFLPTILSKLNLTQYDELYLELLVGKKDKSILGTICLTAWALILFLQPVVTKYLEKLTTEKERKDGLVNFQVFPQEEEEAELTMQPFESFENSLRYYVSNWFLEFHNEMMVAVLLVAAVSRKNVYGIVYSLLALLHILIPMFGESWGIVATVSFTLQMTCFIVDYCLGFLYVIPHFMEIFRMKNLIDSESERIYTLFLDLGSKNASSIFNSALGGAFVCLTIRWYLTSKFFQNEKPKRRFDSHWCRLCSQVNHKSQHAYSKIKQFFHLYLGWAAHAALFITAITAYYQPTLPTVILLILSLVFFFFGESSILMPQLRGQVNIVLGVIVTWAIADSLVSFVGVFFNSYLSSEFIQNALNYMGLTNVLKYAKRNSLDSVLVFESITSRGALFVAVFLILLQVRIYRSKAWPFVLARMYHSYATSTGRAQLFNRNLQAAITFQQKHLEKAAEHVKKQLSYFKSIDITDWKSLCYVPKVQKETDNDDISGKDHEMPKYGSQIDIRIDETSNEQREQGLLRSPTETDSQPSRSSTVHRRKKATKELRSHLAQVTSNKFSDEEDHLDNLEGSPDLNTSSKSRTFRSAMLSSPSLDHSLPSIMRENQKKTELEGNFYMYTWVSFLRLITKYFLSLALDYRRLENRPSYKTSLRIIFHHKSIEYRVRFLVELLIDVFNSNFDYVIDILAIEAHLFHSSGFSLLMVLGILLISRLQRPFPSKLLYNRLVLLASIWILFNYCYVLVSKTFPDLYTTIKGSSSAIDIAIKMNEQLKLEKILRHSIYHRLIGIHILGDLEVVTLRPTLLLLALSYKRSLMRHLGLWDYGRGIQMARIYYQTEDDLDESEEFSIENENNDNINITNIRKHSVLERDDLESDSASSGDEDIDSDISDQELMNSDDEDSDLKLSTTTRTWKEIMWPTIQMPWRDYYVPMFAADFMCLFLMMYYWGDFAIGPIFNDDKSSSSTGFFQEMINQNMIPGSLVNMVILSSFILVLDRALYVSKNYLGKVLLQVSTVIGYHIYVFFYLPQFYADPNLSNLYGLKVWYLCKWIYWISSAMQLQYSYPPLRTEVFLSSNYGIISANLHTMYRTIPFIEELRTIIDWSMTPSSLGIWPWLKLADIYERFYAVQCARAFQRTYFGRHRFGMPFDQFNKIGQGIFVIAISILIFWSPFLILSRSSMMSPNTVSSFKLELSIVDQGSGAFLTFQRDSFDPITDEEYRQLRYSNGVNPVEVDKSYFTKVLLPKMSNVPWNANSGSIASTVKYLRTSVNASIQVDWTVKRHDSQAFPEIRGSNRIELNEEDQTALAQLLDLNDPEKSAIFSRDFKSNFIPRVINAPLTEVSTALNYSRSSLRLTRLCSRTKKGKSKLTRELVKKAVHHDQSEFEFDWPTLKSDECVFMFQMMKLEPTLDEPEKNVLKCHPAEVFIYSMKRPKYSFSSFNLVGLYATVVFTVAQLFRMMHADMTTRIQYDDLPNPVPLLILCQQILMLRELGDFESEETIYWQLIEILRNPQTLLEMTKI